MLTILSIERAVDHNDNPTDKTMITFKIDDYSQITIDAIMTTHLSIESFDDAETAVKAYFMFISTMEKW